MDVTAGEFGNVAKKAPVALGFPSIKMVVENDVCVGCGVCAVASGGDISVELNEDGYYSAELDDASVAALEIGSSVCPFANESANETAIARDIFRSDLEEDDVLGRYLSVYAGQTRPAENLIDSSSGGMTSWLATELLDRGLVDGIVHVGSATEPLFEYMVSCDVDSVLANRKSMYYSTTIAGALEQIRGDGRRYAFIGVPCFVTSLRHLCQRDEVLHAQIGFFIGLVCGHLKSSFFAESLAWQCGVGPDRIGSVDFRIKREGRSSSDYDFGAVDSLTGEALCQPTQSLVGGNWGHGLFQLNACNFCDDIFAETADITFGDAWLPRFKDDWRGTNVVVCRDPQLDSLLQAGSQSGLLELEVLTAEDAVATQLGNVRHRRVGLSVRLADDAAGNLWTPVKRVSATYSGVSRQRLSIIRARRDLSSRSFVAFRKALESGRLQEYLTGVADSIARFDRMYAVSTSSRRKRIVVAFIRRFGLTSLAARMRSRTNWLKRLL